MAIKRIPSILTQAMKKQYPGAGGIESFYQDHGDPPFSPFDGSSCNKEIIREELEKLIKII